MQIPALCSLLAVLLFIGALAAWSYVLFPSVSIPEQQPDSLAQTSRIYAADGSVLATLHGEINREPIPLGDLPPYVPDAAVSAEDARFFEHDGVDKRSVVRALIRDLAANAWVQGGSTITQQYVKDAYVGNEKSLTRKLKEARLARQLERKLTKEEILELYLNTVYFGRGAYGIQAAANAFFDKPAAQLSLSEAAQLIGVIPAPVRYSPYEHPDRAERRRQWVLDRMVTVGHITPEQAQAAKAEKPQIAAPKVMVTSNEDATSAWFVDAVKRYLFNRYGAERVLTGGLEVRTTLDPKLQAAAGKIVARNLPDEADPYAAIASVDPRTGYVKALVGGRDYAKEKYNIAVQGRRQPGSAFKPFVLVAALEEGISPSAVFSGPSSLCISGWKPDCRVHNFGGQGFGRITLAQATVNSVNTVYAQLIMRVGADKVVDTATRMGIPAPTWMVPAQVGCRPLDSPVCLSSLRPRPSLALGAQEVTPLEMASAYATLAGGGVYRAPKVASKITDRSGKVLEEGPSEGRQVIAADVAEKANEILTGVIKRGTGRRADIGRAAAGKTGTAQDHRNAWFVGYTKEMSTAVWMGYRDSNLPLVDIHGVSRVTGGTIPAQMWAQYMSDADLKLSQSPSPAAPLLVGRKVSQRFAISNGGPWEAAGVTFSELLPKEVEILSARSTRGKCRTEGGVVCDLGGMGAGDKAVVTVTFRPHAPGQFATEATVRGGGTDPSADNNAVQRKMVVVPAADVVVDVGTASAPLLLGGDVVYTAAVTNRGPSPATDVSMTQSLPPSATVVSSTVDTPIRSPATGFCLSDGNQNRCTIGTLPAGTTSTVTLIVRPDKSGRFVSEAAVDAAEADGNRKNNGSKAAATVIPAADLTLTGSSPAEPVPIGHPFRYTFEIANAGPSEATNVSFTDILPAGTSLVSAKSTRGRCKESRSVVECAVGSLAVKDTAKVTVEVLPSSTGRAVSEARLEAREADPVPADRSAAPASQVVPSADLSVRARTSPDVVLTGGEITYEIHVANAGLSPATGVVLTKVLPEGTTLVSAAASTPGSSPACKVPEPARRPDRRKDAAAAGAAPPRPRTVVCQLGGIGVREHIRVVVVLRGDVAGPVTSRVEARGADLDPEPDNNALDVTASVASGSGGSPVRVS